MSAADQKRIRELIDRLDRIMAADEWGEDLNPAQMSALSYLSAANRFSRSPSQVADYMRATRGTVSQTLKALARKGLIEEERSEVDRRSISYFVTGNGYQVLQKRDDQGLDIPFEPSDGSQKLADSLEALARNMLKQRGLRSFGICRTCIHNKKTGTGNFCTLLKVRLDSTEIEQLCHEHSELS